MTFKEKVVKVVHQIPYGKVVSYGQVAAAIGSPRAARQVGWALKATDGDNDFPWWRVINSQGLLSIKGNWSSTKQLQKEMLEQEGVQVSGDYKIEISKYRHQFL
ncbi:MAG: methylated-DNA--[protein]-cysteine S-methyltransferase [Candidatus Doudnabacteria bacterium]